MFGSEAEGLLPPPRVGLTTRLRSVKHAHNTLYHYGVMAQRQTHGAGAAAAVAAAGAGAGYCCGCGCGGGNAGRGCCGGGAGRGAAAGTCTLSCCPGPTPGGSCTRNVWLPC